MGLKIGYVRVSSIDQNTERQLDGFSLDKVFEDKQSGKDTKRPQLQECLNYCRSGDTLHVHSIDRLARNLSDLLSIVKRLSGDGVNIYFHKEKLNFNGNDDAMSELMLSVIGAIAQFQRSLIRVTQMEGIEKAKQRGVYKGGAHRKLPAEKVRLINELKKSGNSTLTIANNLQIAQSTVYKYLEK